MLLATLLAVLLDDFSTVAKWEAHPSDGVELKISSDVGKTGKAMRLDFDFRGGGGYGIARLPVKLDLPENYEFTFWIRGETPVNTLEFKLLDPSRENVWWSVRRRWRFPTEWTRVRIKKRHLQFAWGPKGGGEISQTSALEIVVVAAEGWKGTIWIDDLAFTPLDPPRPFASERNRFTSPRIDFGHRRELGGLTIDWERADDYDVLTSIDGKEWETVWRVRDGDDGRDYVVLPEGEARYVRVSTKGTIREINVLPPEFSETKNAMFHRIARDAPRGFYPKYLLGTQSYWTIIGAPGDTREALINEEGTIDIDPTRFSIDPFLSTDFGRFLTWDNAKTVTQSLANGELPIPTVVRDYGDARLTITAFSRGEAGHSVLWVRYRVENLAVLEQKLTLHLAIRPLQVNPSWQFLAVQGGATEIVSLAREGDAIVVNDTTSIVPLTKPDAFGAMRFDQGDLVQQLSERRMPAAQRADDPFGSASGVMSWSFSLFPNTAREIAIAIPFHERPANLGGSVNEELAVATSEWSARLGRVAFHLPESGKHIERAIRSNLAYILINMDGPSIQPGSRSYDRSWIRDGSLTSAALLRLDHAEEVKRFIEWYALHQRANGYVPCCVGARGADPVPEHDSHGQFIYLIKEYYDFTGDRALLERMWPHVQKAVAFIDTLRRERMTDQYKNTAFYGLVPESISHEGYSAKPMHSYWDDFFVLKGLKDATDIARILGHATEAQSFATIRDEFRRDVYASVDRAMQNHKIDYIPGSVELGDFDATSTTTIVNPGGEFPAALQRTFDKYWENFVTRRASPTWDAYTPYEWRVAGTYVRLGQPDRAHALIDWFFTHTRPAAWNHWAEVVHRDVNAPKFIGDMPHTWVGSDFIRSMIDLFAYERDRDETLVLAAGIPLAWLSTKPTGVTMLRTRYGPLTYSMTREGNEIVVRIDRGLRVPPGGIVIVSPVDGREMMVRQLPAELHIPTQ